MKFKNFKLRPFISNVIILILYPIYKAVSSTNGLLAFLDAIYFVSLGFIIFGIIYSMDLHGDFDITGFVLERTRNHTISYDKYMADAKEKNKGRFNYPLFIGVLSLMLCTIASYLLY